METTSRQRHLLDAESLAVETLPAALARWAEIRGDECAVTFVDYSRSLAGDATSLSWRELNDRVDVIAAWCRRRAGRGDRAAVLIPQSIDYVAAFLGALRAGLIAVPLFEPSPLPGHTERLAAVLADCEPALVLTVRDHADAVEGFLAEHSSLSEARLVAVDVLPQLPDEDYEPARLTPDDLAYLQYTSGSTRTPAGVMITHGNVVANARQGVEAYEGEPGRSTVVSWLPLFHDMGLVVGVASPIFGGLSATLMDPLAFIAQPKRWLRQLAATPGPAITAAPNFAYAYVASRTKEEDKAELSLGHVVTLGDGSEPVLPSTLDKFYAKFADCGLEPRMHRHTYGLAEAVVMVTVSPAGSPPRRQGFDRVSLAAGRAVLVEPGTESSSTLVSAGQPVDQLLRIADPRTGIALPDGEVGEIWASGPNVGQGYWGSEAESASVFDAELSDADGNAIPPYPGRDGWLRTGDLGVLVDGDLFITGRLKDLIIVDGQNHYPQDVEYTVEQAHPAVRRHAVAAFSVPGPRGEQAVVVAERAKQVDGGLDRAEVAAAVRSIVSRQHGLSLRDVLMIGPGELPRTSSGKIQRSACRVRYLEGAFTPVAD
ncbi:fatty acyl-AMP ligase [Amycolatopsis anabasis]|uniref:fatty acyl-AMP ligase n=1 Tax=Amycolatopsis anabasis TaxID=1840409 RepID=UPI00131AE20A|nr:fatty acyl-AMP ligase [Amycolatopsis anabasis]